MMQRGAIYNPARASQLRDFSGLCFDKITPSDLDAVIDFGGKAFVMIELKVAGLTLPLGQRILLERLTDKLNTHETKALALVAEHKTPASQSIDVASCLVTEYRNDSRIWIAIIERVTVHTAINTFLKRVGLDGRYTPPARTENGAQR